MGLSGSRGCRPSPACLLCLPIFSFPYLLSMAVFSPSHPVPLGDELGGVFWSLYGGSGDSVCLPFGALFFLFHRLSWW